MKKILLIGAGASYGARFRHKKRPPLGAELLDFLRTRLEPMANRYQLASFAALFLKAKKLIEQSGESNFESLVAKLPPDDRETIHRSLQILFCDLHEIGLEFDLGLMSKPDGYDLLSDRLALASGEWDIISLNYDILCEQALNRRSIHFHYPQFPFGAEMKMPPAILRVFKPHGSINFFTADNEHFSIFGGRLGTKNIVDRVRSPQVHPFMAPHDEVCREALKRAAEAEAITIVGVDPRVSAKDDPFTYELLRLPFPQATFIGKGDDANTIKALYPQAKVHPKGLEGFLLEAFG